MTVKLRGLTAIAFCLAFTFVSWSTGISPSRPTPSSSTACDVKGVYVGRNLSSTGGSIPIVYDLRENNFAVGSITLDSAPVTFGGYRNTCDSVILSVRYESSGDYYLLEGVLTNNKNTISGTFKNLTNVSDFGTFTISKLEGATNLPAVATELM